MTILETTVEPRLQLPSLHDGATKLEYKYCDEPSKALWIAYVNLKLIRVFNSLPSLKAILQSLSAGLVFAGNLKGHKVRTQLMSFHAEGLICALYSRQIAAFASSESSPFIQTIAFRAYCGFGQHGTPSNDMTFLQLGSSAQGNDVPTLTCNNYSLSPKIVADDRSSTDPGVALKYH